MAFSDNIWKTRKSRINTSERLKTNDLLSQILITYYSLFIIIIVIIDMNNTDLNFEILTLVLSILILVVSTFIFSRNYKERSLMIQSAYIKMDKIYREMQEKERKEEDIADLKEQYNTILELTENHSTCDFLQVMYEVRKDKRYIAVNGKWDYSKCLQWLWCKTAKYLFVFSLFIVPIIVLFVILY
ncbi:MAG: SLATT domain-containing protein [Arcobacteraceae bacterium]